MAHVRQELRLGAAGRLGLMGEVVGLPRRLLELVGALLHLALEVVLRALHLLAGLAQLAEHGRERCPELPQLVARVDVNRVVQASLRHGARRFDEAVDRGGDLARQQDRRGDPEQDADRGRRRRVHQERPQPLAHQLLAETELDIADHLSRRRPGRCIGEEGRLPHVAGAVHGHQEVEIGAPVHAIPELADGRLGPVHLARMTLESRQSDRAEGALQEAVSLTVGKADIRDRRIGVQPCGDLLQGLAVLRVQGILAVLRNHRRQGGAVGLELLDVGRDLLAHDQGAQAQRRRQDGGDDQRVELRGQPELLRQANSHRLTRSPPAPPAGPVHRGRASEGAPS